MRQWMPIRRALTALGCVLMLAVAACGTAGTNGNANRAYDAPPASTTATTTASATIAHPSTATPKSTGGAVALSVGAAQYAGSSRVAITLHNGRSATIYAQEHGTSCSLVVLERLVNGVWQPVFPCADGFPHPQIVRVDPGAALTIHIAPVVTGDAQGLGATWPAGTYRARLQFVTSETIPFSQGAVVYSTTFTVA
jgi:hypothetical protein